MAKININKTHKDNHDKFKKLWKGVREALSILSAVAVDDSVKHATMHVLNEGENLIKAVNDVAVKIAVDKELSKANFKRSVLQKKLQDKQILVNQIFILNPLVEMSRNEMLSLDLEAVQSIYDAEVKVKEEASQEMKDALDNKERIDEENLLMEKELAEKKRLVKKLLKKKAISNKFGTETLMAMSVKELNELF